uniref:RING-type E3 ubiquitin transferase n=1 Tax=Nelumbo nucifera TaxID=4432 RepID=A0A822YRC8_NELNU|nr:TPA_asm: hypothetical protein HUJ06_007395 [Nelumbo nucifera]
MDPGHGYLFEHVQTPPLMENQANVVYHPSSPSSDTSFPILAIAILGILTTAFLLVSYYVFVIKCCLTWHRFDLLRRFSMSQARRHEDPLMAYVQATENRGLDESLIRAIPVFQFKRGGKGEEKSYFDCAVCLNEFQEEEKLRILPNCAHAFHIDCIDIWLQSNANCPLCRSSISTTARFPIGQIIAPTPSPQDPHPFTETLMGGDEDFVATESAGRSFRLAMAEDLEAQFFLSNSSPKAEKLILFSTFLFIFCFLRYRYWN